MVRLCDECKNLLYPVGSMDKKLSFVCKYCNTKVTIGQSADKAKIYEHALSTQDFDVRPLMHKDLVLDPGMPQRKDVPCPNCKRHCENCNSSNPKKPCPSCEKQEVKYFCPYKESMSIYFVCCKCYCYWKQPQKKAEGDAKVDGRTNTFNEPVKVYSMDNHKLVRDVKPKTEKAKMEEQREDEEEEQREDEEEEEEEDDEVYDDKDFFGAEYEEDVAASPKREDEDEDMD